ncbi:hypothetical protein RISK_001166 [Rhodopirellula islandica]|uniref:Uncharacterized protein n=1 Tax=Rhodopirellula islandica TaxID=595434 RepID=A0A0J1BK13_RHOIS|nr:hypothetical protein RISK_001166 [Rhodopirellula islandica]
MVLIVFDLVPGRLVVSGVVTGVRVLVFLETLGPGGLVT